MVRLRNITLTLLFSIALTHLAGCTGARTLSHEPPRNEPPSWVRVVVPERDGRSLFVGGVSFAADPEAGVAAAVGDARSQVHLKATRRFTDSFNVAVRESDIETTPMERLDFKNSVMSVYGSRMAEIARQDSVFYRPCGDAEAAERVAGVDPGTPVCQVFVLMSVDAAEWDRVLGEVLAVEKSRRAEEDEGNMSDFARWLSRHILEEQPEGARERTR